MKKIHLYIIASVALLAGLSSCSEDFLTIKHTDIVTPEVFFMSQDNVEMGLNGIYDLLICERSSSEDLEQNWNLKPQIAFSNYPANDLQPDGWDREFSSHTWKADFYMFGPAWQRAYRTIDRVNNFLANLENVDPAILENGQATKDVMTAEARALRAWFYTFLCQSWGGVPMLMTGESYSTHPGKERGTTEEAWNLIIEDYEYARDHLEWAPRNGEKGRVTKGMAKAYLGLAYMYQKRWTDAKRELSEIINSGNYELNPCYAYNHVINQKWPKESVWEIAYNQWPSMTWGSENTYPDAVWYCAQMFASGEYGGWGPSHTSFEFIWSHEPGDRRVEYNVAQYGDLNLGYPSQTLGEPGSALVGVSNAYAQPFVGTDILPNNYNQKFWRYHPSNPYGALPITYMRLAGVMLNYAECCFETGDAAEGWKYIKTIRDRAWGKLEPFATPISGDLAIFIDLNTNANIEAPDAETYYSNYKRTVGRNKGLVNTFMGWMPTADGTGDSLIATPASTNVSQQTRRVGIYERRMYESPVDYTPYSIPVWKVAVLMERRHEFYGEYSFWQDLCRMGIAKEYLDAEYPRNNIPHPQVDLTGTHEEVVARLKNFDFTNQIHTWRPNEFDPNRQLFPIPTIEMDGNPALQKEDQNPGYF